ncbi:Uu.00g066450.m01.CDS01 [Anthostomella pinea]|uniref:Uu.00g066450.m01.CDS01 n=1 Tax=Anthostomella pinea TaxID=933095 RepID=A0AAI8VUL3_9PEZI|nr:Uu.00g066450.m01.CDS01 [Anthostomella pinea]
MAPTKKLQHANVRPNLSKAEASQLLAPNWNFEDGSLTPRKLVGLRGLDRHMAWDSQYSSPFISFFSDWNVAVRRRKWIMANGGAEVVILAVWAKDLVKLYDAHRIAFALGYRAFPRKGPRRLLYHHQHEYLHFGPLLAGGSHIIALFDDWSMAGAAGFDKKFWHPHPFADVREWLRYHSILRTDLLPRQDSIEGGHDEGRRRVVIALPRYF